MGYSPWGYKDLDMTEWLSTEQHMVIPATDRGGTSTPASRSAGVTNISSGSNSNRSG